MDSEAYRLTYCGLSHTTWPQSRQQSCRDGKAGGGTDVHRVLQLFPALLSHMLRLKKFAVSSDSMTDD